MTNNTNNNSPWQLFTTTLAGPAASQVETIDRARTPTEAQPNAVMISEAESITAQYEHFYPVRRPAYCGVPERLEW